MEAIIILRRCRTAAGEIRWLNQRIQQRREAMTSLSAPPFDPNGGSHGQSAPDKLGKLLSDIDSLERSLENRKQARLVEIAAACALLDRLPALESSVLHGFYIKQESTSSIAKRLNYQDSYIRKVKINAEKTLGELTADQVAAALPLWYLQEYGSEK